MDIKQLIYLCNLERERHFGRAAEASFVSQPTLSMRLKNLERELGVALINRGNNFEGFTAEGERVLSWAREIVSVYQGLKLEVESLKNGLNGTLRIGVVPQCSISLARLLKSAGERYPHLDYRVSVLSADQLLEALTGHSVDVGIGFFELTILNELHFQAQPLVDSGVDVVFHPEHFPELIGTEPLTLSQEQHCHSVWRSLAVTSGVIWIIVSAMQGYHCMLGWKAHRYFSCCKGSLLGWAVVYSLKAVYWQRCLRHYCEGRWIFLK